MAKQADSNYTTSSTRRAFLRSAAIASAAAAVPAGAALAVSTPSISTAVTAPIRDNPKLLALGEKIGRALSEYRVAFERKNAALRVAEALCPTVPNELLLWPDHYLHRFGACERQTDIEGKVINPKPPQEYFEVNDPLRRGVVTTERLSVLRKDFAASGCGPRTRGMREINKIFALAEKYEAERRQAIDAAGLLDAAQVAMQAAADLHCHCDDALCLEAQSAAGLRVLTDAVHAQCECDEDSPYKSTLPHTHAVKFARSVRRAIDGTEGTLA